MDYRGYAPDIWCEPQDALTAVLALLQNSGIADAAACDALNAAITASYEAEPLPSGNVVKTEEAQGTGIMLIWQGNVYQAGDILGGWEKEDLITVYYNGQAVTDYTLKPTKKSICKMEKIEKGKDAGKIRADAVQGSKSSFSITCGGETAEFIWKAG